MGEQVAEKFQKSANSQSFHQQQREMISSNMEKYSLAFENSKTKFFDLANSKKKASLTRWKSIENMERYLLDFESNFSKRGGHVVWANDAEDARQEISTIMKRHQVQSVAHTRSILTEEIELSHFLQQQKAEVLDADFNNKLDLETEPEIAETRKKYSTADISFSQADFLIADTGSVTFSENDGHIRFQTAFSKVHVVLVGIDKIIPNIQDLDLFWPLLASHGTGQNLTAYNSILSGPMQEQDTDGPEAMYVVLLDNGRTNVLEKSDQRQALYCICSPVCINMCPTHQHINGKSYDSTYQTLIHSLVPANLQETSAYEHPAFASPLSGKFYEACAVGIDFPRLALLNRRDTVQQGLISKPEVRAWKGFTYAVQRRGLIDFFSGKTKRFILRNFFRKIWGKKRDIPKISEKSFSKQWKEQNKGQ